VTGATPVAVLGAGHSGFGLAGDLALRGVPVHLYEHPDFEAAIAPVREAGGIAVRGVTGEGVARPVLVTTDAGAALADVRLAFVVVPAYAHDAMAAAVARHLQPDHVVVLMPGNAGGALAFRRAVTALGGPAITVAEAASFIFACKKDGPAGVWIRGVKHGLPVGVLPAERTDEVMAWLLGLYPTLAAGMDVLETSLSNANHVAHPPALLLNIARIEATGGDYSFFHEGMTPSVARLTDAIDAERLSLVATLGYEPVTTLEQLTRFYGDQGFGGATYYDAVHTTPVHGAARAPGSIDHRYFTEDLPYGLVPLAEIGAALDVPMSATRGLVDVVNALSGADHWTTGRTLAQLGLGGMNAAEMRAYARTGTA
jgi:opine dehydrogenase